MRYLASYIVLGCAVLLPTLSRGYTVHYIQQTVAGTTNVLSDIKTETGPGYVTQTAPSIDGYGFTAWSISVRQAFESRDEWGRAHDFCTFGLYEASVLTANYLANNIDSDHDGIGDCWELYWYGDLDETGQSDEDGDGYTFVQELHANTNPHFKDVHVGGLSTSGPVKIGGASIAVEVKNDNEETTFLGLGPEDEGGSSEGGGGTGGGEGEEDEPFENPNNYPVCTIRSDPVGLLFKTRKLAVKPGETVTTESYDFANSCFGQWEKNGVRQADDNGIALSELSFAMPISDVELVARASVDEKKRALYHYHGDVDMALYDTDGDGYCDEYETAAGTSNIRVDAHISGGVSASLSMTVEVDLQPHEQLRGVILDGEYSEVFYSPSAKNGGTCQVFGPGLTPYVVDVNGDGLWDIVLKDDLGTITIWINTGTSGNPEFVVKEMEISGFSWETNSISRLDAYSLDTPTYEGLSVTYGDANGDGVTDILVSDVAGRIWYYQNASSANIPMDAALFELQHKAWGGSFVGFAEGLKIAAVDWEDDGDLDCLCGTADGRLMLLRDPQVGRPTNLKAAAGTDNVKLNWDPNEQSRVRGYKVHRAVGGLAGYGVCGESSLPTYRDEGLSAGTYSYKVSALSRFYTAGNSTPTVTESIPTEPVTATVGGPIITIGDPVKMPDGTVQIVVSINNSMNYQAAGTSIAVPYDAANLAYQKTLPSGISEKLDYKTTTAGGVATIAITSGEVAPGSGTFFTLVFYGLIDGVLMGDLDGDGDVDEDDLRILIRASSLSGRKYTDYQLKAGDFNHNGKLDNGDVQSLRSILKGENQL